MKGFSSKRIALKVDMLEGRKIHSLQARPCFFAGNFKGWGSEGVKHYVYFLLLQVMSARHVRTLAPHHHHHRHHHQLPVDVSRFGPAVRPRLVNRGTSVGIRSGSPVSFSLQKAVSRSADAVMRLCPSRLGLMKREKGSHRCRNAGITLVMVTARVVLGIGRFRRGC